MPPRRSATWPRPAQPAKSSSLCRNGRRRRCWHGPEDPFVFRAQVRKIAGLGAPPAALRSNDVAPTAQAGNQAMVSRSFDEHPLEQALVGGSVGFAGRAGACVGGVPLNGVLLLDRGPSRAAG
jgi:hypothetical protein